MAYRNFAPGMLAGLLVLAVVSGCGQETVPMDLTQTALHQVRSGKYDEAIATATAAMRANPQAAAPYLYRGRAYHFRNGLGDRQRAIADFGEAIRLAPESSDAYYSRALVYRDIGQTELADADDAVARDLDGLIKETYDQLPDLTPSTAVAKASDADPQAKKTGSKQGKSDRELYQELKNQFDPGFGQLRRTAQPSSAKSGAAGTPEEPLTTRYRSILEGTPEGAESGSTGATSNGDAASQIQFDQFGQFKQPAATAPAAAPESDKTTMTPLSPSMGTAPARPGGNWQGLPPQTLSSPFAQRPTVPGAGELPPGIQTPFPKRATGSTGYVQPVNPFGAGTRQAPVTRPFGTPAPGNRFSNPNVRPDNPRDYLP